MHRRLPYFVNRLSYTFWATTSSKKHVIDDNYSFSPNVYIVNLSAPININNTCVKSKTLLNYISPTICLHERKRDTAVSGAFYENNTIWEEDHILRILKLLLRYPHLDFIDIGANIGAYTMYAAALGRFVLAIDCFAPNIALIQKAVRLTNVVNRVVLVQNALFTRSGELLRLSVSNDNVGGQALLVPKNQTSAAHAVNNSSTTDPYVVKTITFDELLPIFMARNIRGAVMKIDIEGSEHFLVTNGGRMFEAVDIPFIQMEWWQIGGDASKAKTIIDFFIKRNYDSTNCGCTVLNPEQYVSWPYDVCWRKKNFSALC